MTDMVCKRCGHDRFYEDGTARYSRSGAVESHNGKPQMDGLVDVDPIDVEPGTYSCASCGEEAGNLESLVVHPQVGVDPEECSCGRGKRKHYIGGAHNWTCSECDCIDYAPAAYGAVAA